MIAVRPSSIFRSPVAARPREAEPVRISETPAEPMSVHPAPDGKRVYFADGVTELSRITRDIYAVDSDGQNLQQLTSAPGVESTPAVSPDGTHVAYVAEDEGKSDIHVMRSDGTEDVNLTGDNAGYFDPQWSPDGKNLLVSSRATGDGNSALFLIAADGSKKTQITPDGRGDNLNGRFSADGERVVFASNRRRGIFQIFSMKLDGSELRDCTPNLMYTDGLALNANGQMVFSAADRMQNIDIYSCPVDGSAPPTQLEDSGLALAPELSPDGRHVTWLSNDEDRRFQVFEAKSDGSDAHPVTHGHGFPAEPHYLADSNTLIFLSNEDGKTELYKLGLDPARD